MPVTRAVRVAGLELACSEAGHGGRPLLLAHGYTGSKEDFAQWIEPLAEHGWHVVVPDHRGHGDSHKPTGEEHYSLDLLASDLLELASSLGWDRFTLLGHSMGGMVAQLVAIQAPERLDALVLMDTGHGPLHTIDAELAALGIEAARTDGMDLIADVLADSDGPLTTVASIAFAAANPEWTAFTDRRLRAVSPQMYAALLAEMLAAEDRLAMLADMQVPTLVLVGEQDEPFVPASQAMAATIPGARLHVVPGAGHSPHHEAPEAWWIAISDFLGSLATEAAAGPAGPAA